MPKVRRSHTSTHEPSVKLSKRNFAVQDNAVEHIDIGSAAGVSADVILAAQNAGPVPSETLTKKEKQASKREAFLHKLKGLGIPSSKSHARREKRKAKEQLHGGGLDDIKTILTTIAASTQSDEKTDKEETSEPTETDRHEDGNHSRMQRRSGRIGKSKTEPLSQNQRKRVLKMERFRQPLIRSDPEFAKNPFATIRIHAENTLVKHES